MKAMKAIFLVSALAGIIAAQDKTTVWEKQKHALKGFTETYRLKRNDGAICYVNVDKERRNITIVARVEEAGNSYFDREIIIERGAKPNEFKCSVVHDSAHIEPCHLDMPTESVFKNYGKAMRQLPPDVLELFFGFLDKPF